VTGGKSFKQLALPGSFNVVALEGSTGLAWGWGYSQSLIGNTTFSAGYESSPMLVSGGKSYNQLYAGVTTAYALEGSTGNLYMWGLSSALTSVNQYTFTPTLLGPPKSWKQFAAGSYIKDSVVVQDSFNTMYYWGDPVQLGVGYAQVGATTGQASSPVSIARFFIKS
jgi:hypothetical protein